MKKIIFKKKYAWEIIKWNKYLKSIKIFGVGNDCDMKRRLIREF